MTIILILLGLFVVGNIMWFRNSPYNNDIIPLAFLVFSSLWLLIALLAWPIYFYTIKAEIAQFNSVRQTIENAREQDRNIETAAFMLKIATSNEWLANIKYWNNTIFDIYIPDEVEELKFLE